MFTSAATLLTLFAGLAASAPADPISELPKNINFDLLAPVKPFKVASGAATPGELPASVRVHGVSLLGTGCPSGTADVQIDATGELFEATFSAYEVQTGDGTRASDWRKNCKLTINMEFETGFQFAVMATDMIGFAEIPAGAAGQCRNTFSFTGQTIAGGGIDKVDFDTTLDGPYSGDFDLSADPGILAWSPCGGGTAILNMNTQCSIRPTSRPALIAVDHISGRLTVQFRIGWRRC